MIRHGLSRLLLNATHVSTRILISLGNFVIACISLVGLSAMNFATLLHQVLIDLARGVVRIVRKLTRLVGSIFKKITKIKLKRSPKAKGSKKSQKSKSRLKEILVRFKFFTLGVIITSIGVVIFAGYSFVKSLPNPRLIGMVNYPVSTKIYDRKGRLLYEFHRDQNRTPVKLKELPDFIWQSTVAIEDKNYFSHNGISIVNGMLRAGKDTIRTGHVQGGSTITQQLIKTSLLTPERTIDRKIKEIILALWAEQLYSKNEILEMYLNQVPYGGSSYGIEAASQTYFGVPSSDLTISEAAFLAGLPQAPSLYSPYSDRTRSIKRRNDVLHAMLEQGYITKTQHTQALQEELVIENPDNYIKAPHFVFYVKSYLEKMFGIRAVEEGGLRVTTSLDLDVQEATEEILSNELATLSGLNIGNGGVVVTHPESGQVLAMVGSKDYFEEPYGSYNVTIASRQPGSSIKPLMYALALMRGYTAASVLDDSPVTFRSAGSPPYQPVNYDGRYHGRVPFRIALANSYNIPAVRVLNTLGVSNFIDHARLMGITTLTDATRYGLSLTLGGGEVKLVDMAVAYGVFANYGKRVDLTPVIKVVDFQNEELYSFEKHKKERQVFDEGIAYIISSILSDNAARSGAFGTNSQLVIPDKTVAVKTGTTNSKRDNLTIGYTRSFLTAVWVGNNDNSPMDQQLTSGVTGAAPIWNKVMSYVLNYNWDGVFENIEGFEVPSSVVEKMCFYNKPEYFIKGTEENISCRTIELQNPTEAAIPQ